MGLILLLMAFGAMVLLGVWEQRRAEKKYEEASRKLREIDQSLDDPPPSSGATPSSGT